LVEQGDDRKLPPAYAKRCAVVADGSRKITASEVPATSENAVQPRIFVAAMDAEHPNPKSVTISVFRICIIFLQLTGGLLVGLTAVTLSLLWSSGSCISHAKRFHWAFNVLTPVRMREAHA